MTSPVPWQPGDASRLLLFDVVGGATLVAGWLGTSETAGLGRQLSWVSVAIVGLLIAGTGNVLWLLAGRRTVGLRLRELLADHPMQEVPVLEVPVSRAGGLVAVAKGTRYHTADCLLVRRKTVVPATAAHRKTRSLTPCEACRPELVA